MEHREAEVPARPLLTSGRVNPLRTPSANPISNRMGERFALAILFTLLIVGPALAKPKAGGTPSAIELVRRMLTAEHTTNVRGKELSFIEPPGLTAITVEREVTRTRSGQTLYKWSTPASQRGTITLDDGSWTRCFVPQSRELITTRSSPQPRDKHSIARLCRLISHNYTVHLVDKERVAGRLCYVVNLIPRSDAVHAMKLWIDTKTYYAVSRQENNAHGHTISLMLFRWVEFPDAIPASQLASPFPANARPDRPVSARLFNNIADLRRAIDMDVCVPAALPAGFEFERCELIQGEKAPMVCLRYTDGWCNLSIYQSAAQEHRPAQFKVLNYKRHPLGDCAIDYNTPDMNFMLIGRVEMGALVGLVNALDPNRERTFLSDTARAYRVPMAVVEMLRSQGLGIDTINALLEISSRSRRPVSGLASLVRDGYCWRDLAHRLHVDPRTFAARVRFFECR